MTLRHLPANQIVALALALSSISFDNVYAAEPLWSLEHIGSAAPRISIDPTLDTQLVPGARFDVVLPDGLTVAGKVIRRLRGNARAPRDLPGEADGMAVIVLPGARAARLFFNGDRPVGITLTDHVREKRHTAAFDGSLSGVLVAHDLAESLCLGFRSNGFRPPLVNSPSLFLPPTLNSSRAGRMPSTRSFLTSGAGRLQTLTGMMTTPTEMTLSKRHMTLTEIQL